MRKLEEVEVKYCDKCNERESRLVSIGECWSCGKEVCGQHYHLVIAEAGEKRHTYVCSDCREEMIEKIDILFDQFSKKR